MTTTSPETMGSVLEVLAQCLQPAEVTRLADALPFALARPLRQGRHVGSFELDELVLRVAGRAQVTSAVALRAVAATCHRLAELVTAERLRALQSSLPESIAALFSIPWEPEVPMRQVTPRRRTLAEGRPGSLHPLSEGRAERAHTESVARADNPHGEEKLSSTSGLTQEREHESIAEGHPGADRPLSGRR